MKLQFSLLLIFVFATVHISSHGLYELLFIDPFQVQSCNNDTIGICSDCSTSSICSNGSISINSTCANNQECIYDDPVSYCTDVSDPSSSECGCPPDVDYEVKCDKYDNHKYIICLDGERTIFTCEGGQVCIDKECREETNATTCVDYPSFVPLNCTAFIICIEEGVTPDPILCDNNEIVSEEDHDCILYEVFSCEGLSSDIYPDPHNCRVYHVCNEGEEPGYPQVCPEGFVFNADSRICEEGGECTLNECTPCTSTSMMIAIDCQRYFQCHISADGNYYTTVEECPEGLCFDPEYGKCVNDSSITPPPAECTDYPSFVPVNCTAFIICVEEGEAPNTFLCDEGEIVSEEDHDCVLYEVFSCEEGLPSGIYPDTHNCSVYHVCSDGEEPGDPQVCPEDSVFNSETKTCEEGGECTLNECTPCTSATMMIGIDCQRYFQCHIKEDEYFYTTVEECPEGLYFDPEYGRCESYVPGCS